MRKAYAHLIAGTRPSSKAKHAKELRQIIRLGSVDEDKGILIVRKEDPYVGHRNLIFCPSSIAYGLITALHLSLSHPSRSQMLKVFSRYFFTLSAAKIIGEVSDTCTTCLALKKTPRELFEQTSSVSPDHPGQSLAADIICRAGQKIFVVRDTLTSYTSAMFVQNETAKEYKEAILVCTLPMKTELSKIRIDCAPGLKALKKDEDLLSVGIHLDFGRAKNVNKNPIAERANQELELEILKIDPLGKAISAATLTQAVSVLNSRIRHNGLSSKEMFFRRDQISGEQLQFSDSALKDSQSSGHDRNHLSSAKSKARGANKASVPNIAVGSVVFVKHEGSKFKSRESYIVTNLLPTGFAVIQKMDSNKGFFGSVSYEVPLDHLYMCGIDRKDPQLPDTSDCDDFDEAESVCSTNDQKYATCSSSDDSDWEIYVPSGESVRVEPENNSLPSVDSSVVQSRPTRCRRRPDRYGSTSYDPGTPFTGENDTVQNWWPNHPRGTWVPESTSE